MRAVMEDLFTFIVAAVIVVIIVVSTLIASVYAASKAETSCQDRLWRQRLNDRAAPVPYRSDDTGPWAADAWRHDYMTK